MNMGRSGCVFFVLLATAALAQESISTKLSGRVIDETTYLEGFYVINLKMEQAVITDNSGCFSIVAIVMDTHYSRQRNIGEFGLF